MQGKAATVAAGEAGAPRGLTRAFAPELAGRLVTAASDVAMVIDRDGVIRDLALGSDDLQREGAGAWLDRRWLDVVTVESRPKVDALLREAGDGGRPRWREINQVTEANRSLMVRFTAVPAGRDGDVLAIGRDERGSALLQQRLVETQQTLERDYARLRDAESRYRLLFRLADDAMLVVDAQTRRVLEANPAAERLLSEARPDLVGEGFAALFDRDSRDDAGALTALAQSAGWARPAQAQVSSRGRALTASASLFRQDRANYLLVRLSPRDGAPAAAGNGADLSAVLERIPDAFVLADGRMTVLAANPAFLDMTGLGASAQAVGRPLSDFLGRAGLERNLLFDALRQHGSVRNFATLLRRGGGDAGEDVEVSAAAAPERDDTVFGFTIRSVERRLSERPHAAPELRRSVEQMTELVGRMTLKELVRETTDLVERLCIEAALKLTRNNRASAAEVLGLSRQSLYSKLHRFGLVSGSDEDD